MADPRIIVPGAIAPGSEIDRVFQEVLGAEKLTVGEAAAAEHWTEEARVAAERALDHVAAGAGPAWTVRRQGPGVATFYGHGAEVPVSLSATLTLESWHRHAEAVLDTLRRVAARA